MGSGGYCSLVFSMQADVSSVTLQQIIKLLLENKDPSNTYAYNCSCIVLPHPPIDTQFLNIVYVCCLFSQHIHLAKNAEVMSKASSVCLAPTPAKTFVTTVCMHIFIFIFLCSCQKKKKKIKLKIMEGFSHKAAADFCMELDMT